MFLTVDCIGIAGIHSVVEFIYRALFAIISGRNIKYRPKVRKKTI